MKDTRPVNLNLMAFRWPLMAITSIMHRISGVVIFFGVAFLLYLLQLSLESEQGFMQAAELMASPLSKLLLWVILAGLLYHLIAGIKHLLMDFGVGETLSGGRTGAVLALIVAAIAIAAGSLLIW